MSKGENLDAELIGLFDGELNPVAAKAQRKVPVPEGLDLDEWINSPPASDDEATEEFDLGGSIDFGLGGPSERTTPQASRYVQEEDH